MCAFFIFQFLKRMGEKKQYEKYRDKPKRESKKFSRSVYVFFPLQSHFWRPLLAIEKESVGYVCSSLLCVFFFVLICRDVLGLNVLDVNNSTDWIRGKGNKANEWNENETKIWKTIERKHITGKGQKVAKNYPKNVVQWIVFVYIHHYHRRMQFWTATFRLHTHFFLLVGWYVTLLSTLRETRSVQ